MSAVGTRGNCGKVSNNGLLESGWLVGDAPGLRYHLVPCIRAGKTLEACLKLILAGHIFGKLPIR